MSNLWERFDNIVEVEEVNEAKEQFKAIPEGTYNVILEELVPGESNNGLPMLKGKFRVTDGECANRLIFYNQLLQNINYPHMTAVNIAQAVEFVGGLLEEDIEFTGLGDFAELIEEIPVGSNHVINVTYGKNDTEKKFPKLKVTEDIDDLELEDDIYGDDEDIEF